MMTKKTATQAAKYVERFGPGAVIYALGLCKSHTDEFGLKVSVLDFDTLVGPDDEA